MVLDSTNDKVLAPCGAKHVYSQSMATHEHITVYACACANGTMLPPTIIFAGGGVPGGAYTHGGPTNVLSELGYMDGELYLLWFEKVFLKYCTRDRPVNLIQDGHKSHNIKHDWNSTVWKCHSLQPPSSHNTCNLDKSIFRPLKAAFGTALKSVTLARQDIVLLKCDFPRVFCHSYKMTSRPSESNNNFKMMAFVLLTHPRANSICSGLQSISRHQKQMLLQLPMVTNLSAHQQSGRGLYTHFSWSHTHFNLSNGASRTCSPNSLLDTGLIPANFPDILQVPQKKERTYI